MALMVDMPETLAKKGLTQGGSTLVRALGRTGGALLGAPGFVVGGLVSVLPNAIDHVASGDSGREFWTDVVVDGAGYIVSTGVGAAAAIIVATAQPEIGVPSLLVTNAGGTFVTSIGWDLYIAPEIARPFVYQHLPGWIH